MLFGLPAVVGTVATYPLKLVITQPDLLIGAVSLLAGVLLAAAGQVVTLRARIADSLVLATNHRITGLLRETMSGVLLAAVAALVDALLLGVLSVVMADDHRWWHVALSGAIVATTAFLALMFINTARRMYSTYLEVFEGGAPLPKTPRRRSSAESINP
ncbi:hypothetical protein [Mycolicibacterium pulveris]|uniref:hypothetical protein n=1 Tax=Mycolicibacterium pulveris TaxID=36813 RepID=UPI003CF0A7BB